MGGVVLGSLMLHLRSGDGTSLGVEVNNFCQLRCPHCYLSGDIGAKAYMDDAGINAIRNLLWDKGDVRNIVALGMEPLADRKSVEICKRLSSLAREVGAKFGIITNGLQLPAYPLPWIDWVDVSLDGGPSTMNGYRGVSFQLLEAKIVAFKKKNPGAQMNVLHVVNDRTVGSVEDMMKTSYLTSDDGVLMFSPFMATNRGVDYPVSVAPFPQIFARLAEADIAKQERAVFLVDPYHCRMESISMEEIASDAEAAGIKDKIYIAEEPEALGIIRLGVDGKPFPTPWDALHFLTR